MLNFCVSYKSFVDFFKITNRQIDSLTLRHETLSMAMYLRSEKTCTNIVKVITSEASYVYYIHAFFC